MKKRRLIKPRTIAPASATPAPQDDVALRLMRMTLMKNCVEFPREMVPILRQLGALGEHLKIYIGRIPSMPEADIRQGLEMMVKLRAAAQALSALSHFADTPKQAAGDALAVPAPGTEKKQ